MCVCADMNTGILWAQQLSSKEKTFLRERVVEMGKKCFRARGRKPFIIFFFSVIRPGYPFFIFISHVTQSKDTNTCCVQGSKNSREKVVDKPISRTCESLG